MALEKKGSVTPPPVVGSSPARYAPSKEVKRTVGAVVALPVEPTKIFAFWELTATGRKPLIRVLDVSRGKAGGKPAFELRAPGHTGSAYISVRPGRRYIVEAGSVGPTGKYTPICNSTIISLPRSSPPKGKAAIPEKYFRFHPTEGSRG